MKCIISLVLLILISVSSYAQNISISGTIFDPNGAVVTNGQIKAVSEKGNTVIGTSNKAGEFEIKLSPGIYSLEVSSPGFITIMQAEFLVVNSTTGKMAIDFVLFGGKYHEPCGYGGSDCLPAKSLIRSYQLKYSPKLKDIRDEFAPDTKPKSSERIK